MKTYFGIVKEVCLHHIPRYQNLSQFSHWCYQLGDTRISLKPYFQKQIFPILHKFFKGSFWTAGDVFQKPKRVFSSRHTDLQKIPLVLKNTSCIRRYRLCSKTYFWGKNKKNMQGCLKYERWDWHLKNIRWVDIWLFEVDDMISYKFFPLTSFSFQNYTKICIFSSFVAPPGLKGSKVLRNYCSYVFDFLTSFGGY